MDATLSFGQWLKQRRRALDLTQAELARRLGCATVTLQKIELDERRPSKELAERLSELLQLPAAERAAFLRVARAELTADRLAEPAVGRQGVAPWQAQPHPTHNLPLQLTSFVGRELELAGVQQMLLDPAIRLLTLTGPGGTGKTRLALQVATAQLDAFRDGVWFVDLAPISDAGLVVTAIAQTLGVRQSGGQTLLEGLTTALRERQRLLVLDNFEQVLDAATVVSALLGLAPQLTVLVTSRETLHLYGEHEYPVPPLPVPDPHRLPALEAVSQYAAVALFIQRAQAVKPDFQVTNATAPAVAEICERLDGLPLAIELAAARSRHFAPEALLARLASRLRTLTGGARDRPARHQTIRAAIDWSYNLLAPDEQRLFWRLAVFVGGWTLEAAEAVCNREGDLALDMLEGLQSLADKSLLRQEMGSDGEPRFRRLETIREYAREHLEESGEAEELRQRHAAYFLALAERAEPELRGHEQLT
jgi:predicted ATPase/transcriptional regulator with XRE-family HTH domain